MPTSVAHMIGGYAALEAGGERSSRRGIFFLFLVVIASNLPDLDFIPGLFFGDSALFHRGASHSLLAAVAVAGGLGVLLRGRFGETRSVVTCVFLAYASHLLLDMVIRNPSGAASGVPLFWPLYSEPVAMLVPGLEVLDPLRWFDHETLQQGFLRSMLSLGGLRIFVVDAILVVPIVPLAWGIARLRARWKARGGAVGSLRPVRRAPRGTPGQRQVLVRSARVL